MPALRTARRVFSAMLIALGLLGLLVSLAWGQSDSGQVYVATIDGTIDLGMVPYVKRTLSTSADAGAEAVLLDINTPGGRLDAALSIKDALLDAEVPVIAYVNREAFSAGALIAISANTIYMDKSAGSSARRRPSDQEGEPAGGKGDLRRAQRLPRRRGGARAGPDASRKRWWTSRWPSTGWWRRASSSP